MNNLTARMLENEIARAVAANYLHQAARTVHDLIPSVPNPDAKRTLREILPQIEALERTIRALRLTPEEPNQ